jgi:hypothetical protein
MINFCSSTWFNMVHPTETGNITRSPHSSRQTSLFDPVLMTPEAMTAMAAMAAMARDNP